MKKRSLILFYILLTFIYGRAQSSSNLSPGLQTLVPASPNASALGKFGEIPVSTYTGIPDISVPLYTLKSRDLEVPISLNYHASGVRVEEIASWVGIGWSLNAGGVITRSIRGMPDDVNGGYFSTRVNSTALAKKYLNILSTGTSLQTLNGNADQNDLTALNPIMQQVQDGAPDIFYFNFGKYTGQFFMNENGQFVASPLQALKIEYATSALNNFRISRWIITTPDGVKYVFGNSMDGTRVAFENNDSPTPWPVSTTGWYLVEIYSPTNDLITLNYTNVNYSYTSRTAEVLNQIVSQSTGGPADLPFKDNTVIINNMTVPRLTSISAANGTITFGVGANRTDLPGEAPLANINIFNKKDLVNPLKKWLFFCDYSTNRLTLNSISEYSAGGQPSGNSYQFSYNSTILPNPNPTQTSINSQDLWGYYNGVLNNVLPQGYTTSTPSFGTVTINGADRHSDETSMMAGSLTKITYPTGGYTTFDYEANKVYALASDNSIPVQGVPKSAGFNFAYDETATSTFTVTYPDPNTHVAAVTGTIHAMLSGCPFDNNGFSQCYYATLEGINGTQYSLNTFPEGSLSLNLPVGTYQMVGQGERTSGQSNNRFYYYLNWTEYPPVNSNPNAMINKPIGGLRIKRITNYDGINTSVTKYLYNKFADTASSAVLVNQPANYANIFTRSMRTCSGGSWTEGYTDYLQVRSYPLIPLMPTQGAAIGYQNVTKLQGENGENGKEEYTFTTANDYPDEYRNFRPYAPSCNFDWRRGQLLKSTVYKNSSGNFIAVQAKANHYSNAIKQSIGYGLQIEVDLQVVTGNCTASPPINADYFVGSFRTVSELQYLQSDTTWTFDQNNPSAYIQTINTYNYDTTLGHYLLLSAITTNSKNQVEESDYQHPQDFTTTGYAETARQQLISNFVLTPVLDQKTIRNGAQVREIKNNYKNFSNNQTLPESIELKVAANPSEKRVEFLRYDNYGNLVQQHKINDVLNSYIMDYNQSYPIASVVNADSTNIAYTSFEADGSGNWTIPDTTRNRRSFITGSQSYDLFGTKTISTTIGSGQPYILSYWSRNGVVTAKANGVSIAMSHTGPVRMGWTYYEHLLPSTTTTVILSAANTTIDELRLYPSAAQMTTYTYQPLVGMTSQCDIANKVIYYEYDVFQRLLRIRDQDYNILKQYEYQYQVPVSCGANCSILPMQNLAGNNTLTYPVGVFNVSGKLLGNATNQVQYISLWNADTADTHRGTLSAGVDSMHFQLAAVAGQALPGSVTGCRYYQFDLPWTLLDGVWNSNAAYVTFGDGTGMYMGKTYGDTTMTLPANTTLFHLVDAFDNSYYIEHTYPDTTVKTLTFYHNDGTENSYLDNAHSPAVSLSKLTNLRGNLPQRMTNLGGSSYQQAGASTVASIANWSSIQSITAFNPHSGDAGVTPTTHMSYAQDFMANNQNLQTISTSGGGYYHAYYRDTTFKISRLKSDWNTYFSNLQSVAISDEHWSRENLTGLTRLNFFALVAATQLHSNVIAGNAPISIPASVLDNIIIQIAAGAGQSVTNGTISLITGGTTRTTASDSAVTLLQSKGWVITLTN